MVNPLVDVDWLYERLSLESGIVILHTSMNNPVTGEQPVIGAEVIPNARQTNFEHAFCDHNSSLPHTLPSVSEFAKQAKALGINNDSMLVIYDDVGIYCAPRVWWMFKAMGHNNVCVLDGGLPAWKAKKYACQKGFSTHFEKGSFEAVSVPLIITLDTLLERRKEQNTKVVDARNEGRFSGVDAEPRAGLRRGHMPKAKNLPFEYVLNNGYMKVRAELRALFKSLKLTDSDVIFTCGSGVTACILALAAVQIGVNNISVYDGSWSEWGADLSLPVEVRQACD